MTQTETHLAAPVPKLHDRAFRWRIPPGPGRPRFVRDAAMVVLMAGFAVTLAWNGFLAWCLLALVRLAIG